MTKAITTWTEENTKLRSTVEFVDGAKKHRVFDAVVYQLDHHIAGRTPRSIVVKTSGTMNVSGDVARLNRLSRRLTRLGYRFNTTLGRCTDGIRGTVFMHRAN